MTNAAQQVKTHVQQELSRSMFGLEPLMDIITINLISGGNLLLTGAPGTGKTLLIKSLSQLLAQDEARIDCGNDIEFTNILHTLTNGGKTPQVHNRLLYLAGINRLTPNTQAILLPIMEEHQLLNNGEVVKVDHDFRIFATQDPDCYDDTYPLLDALNDRFYMSLGLAYPEPEQERDILKNHDYPADERETDRLLNITPIPNEIIQQARATAKTIPVADSVYDYTIRITQSLRHHDDRQSGTSSRGTLSCINAARIHASLMDRDYINPDDIQAVFLPCIQHRLRLKSDALINGTQTADIITAVVKQTELPDDQTN